ncbi:DUF2875 family protein [Pseudomonas amygdali pv. morsprunorum]|nr:DUF2875 family protein [Pseudomonas amygdali pv. morsprunorum]
MKLIDMGTVLRWSIAVALGTALLAYSGHWWGKAIAHERAEFVAYKTKIMAQASEQEATQKRTYALEIRGVGIGIYHDHQSEIWKLIKRRVIILSQYTPETQKTMMLLLTRAKQVETLKSE